MVMTRSERHREAGRTCDLSNETRTRLRRCSRPNIDTPSERVIRNPTIRAAASGAPTDRRRKVSSTSVALEPPSKRACVSPIEDTSLHDVAETKSSVSDTDSSSEDTSLHDVAETKSSVSDTDSSSEGTSLDEVAESDSSISLTLSPSTDAEAADEILPSRLFATDRYPRNGKLRVHQILIPTARELSADRSAANMADPKVTYLLNLIHGGYCFRKSDWVGGDDSLDKLCICKKNKHAPCTCGSFLSYDEKEEVGEGTCSSRGLDSSSQVAKLWAEVARLKKSKSASFGKLRVSLISEIKSLLSGNNCLPYSPSVDSFNTKLPSSGSSLIDTVGDQTSHPVGTSSNIQTIDAFTGPIDPLSGVSLSTHGIRVSNSNYAVRLTDADSGSQISPSKRLYLANLRRPPNDSHFNDHISEKAIIPSSFEVNDTMGQQVAKHYASCNTLIAQSPVLLPTTPTFTSGALDPDRLWNPECASHIQPANSDPVDHSTNILSVPLHCGYVPFQHLPPHMSLKFKHQLEKYKKSSYDIDGCEVWNTFFSEIYTPQCSLFQTHLDFMLRSFWSKCGSHLAARNIGVVDSLLTQLLSAQYSTFLQAYNPSAFVWHPLLASYVEGTFGDRVGKTIWFKDVHTVYTPMHWGNRHWVGLVISLNTWHIDILDPLVKETSASMVRSYMAPLVNMLPHLIMATCDPQDIPHVDDTMFSYSRFQPVAQNTRGGDSGVYAMKFIEMHSHGYDLNHLSHITTVMVDNFRMQYAMDVYIEFIGKFCG